MPIKQITISLLIGLLLGGLASGFIVRGRTERSYGELENRYLTLEESNSRLREENQQLIYNNNQLRAEQQKSADLIDKAKGIIREFKSGIGDSQETVDRIEKGIATLERLIGVLFTEAE